MRHRLLAPAKGGTRFSPRTATRSRWRSRFALPQSAPADEAPGRVTGRSCSHGTAPSVRSDARLGELSKAIRGQVAAREKPQALFEGNGLTCDADVGVAEVREFCQVHSAGRSLLRAAMQQLGMTARSYQRVLKLARTITELEGGSDIAPHHPAKAMSIRPASRARPPLSTGPTGAFDQNSAMLYGAQKRHSPAIACRPAERSQLGR